MKVTLLRLFVLVIVSVFTAVPALEAATCTACDGCSITCPNGCGAACWGGNCKTWCSGMFGRPIGISMPSLLTIDVIDAYVYEVLDEYAGDILDTKIITQGNLRNEKVTINGQWYPEDVILHVAEITNASVAIFPKEGIIKLAEDDKSFKANNHPDWNLPVEITVNNESLINIAYMFSIEVDTLVIFNGYPEGRISGSFSGSALDVLADIASSVGLQLNVTDKNTVILE